MITFGSEFGKLKRRGFTHTHTFFYFEKGDWKATVTDHFKNILKPHFGIYILRNCKDEVLYVGKGGTVKQDGKRGKQNVPGRLKNVRGKDKDTRKDISSQKWMQDIVKKYGRVKIECLLFDPDKFLAPAFAEACLLQGYRNENQGKLPPKNNSY